MPRFYNEIAGKNLERLTALSDGVFAVAMTLLVLDLRAPAAELIHGETDLLHALGIVAPRLITYAMSFLTLGIFWVGQQVQLTVRPEAARLHRDAAPGRLPATVTEMHFLGNLVDYKIRFADGTVMLAQNSGESEFAVGSAIFVSLDEDRTWLVP